MSYERDNHLSPSTPDAEEIDALETKAVPGKQTRAFDVAPTRSTKPGAVPRVLVAQWKALANEGARLSRKAAGDALADDAGAKVRAAQGQTGDALPAELRAALERSLGRDLGAVRVHTDTTAAAAAHAVSARAFALGEHVFFADGAFEPDRRAGRELIAHEVAHTVDAGTPTMGSLTISSPSDQHERLADEFASAFVAQEETSEERGALGAELGAVPAGVIHRDDEGEESEEDEPSHEDQLRDIQGLQMSSLLTELASLPPEVKTDYEAAHVGGPRLKAAMYAVNEGGDWVSYIDAHHGEAGHLPKDQLEALMDYLGGAPKDYGYFKDVGNFDGSVDPTGKVITLYFRIFFKTPEDGGAHFPGKPGPGSPGWAAGMKQGLADFGANFKKIIEAQWSGKGNVKCGVTELGSFTTRVQVAVTAANPHTTVTLVTHSIRSGHELGGDEGTWGVNDNQHDDKESHTGPGGKDDPVKTKQTTSSHEFGHAIGVKHPDDYEELRQQYMKEKDPKKKAELAEQLRAFGYAGDGTHKQELEYGNTKEELNNMMGAGDELKVIRGDDFFDPFVPFQKIGKAWGDQHIKVETLNTWSSE